MIAEKIDGAIKIYCNGCKRYHYIHVDRDNLSGVRWEWNGDIKSPTFTPSINIVGKCHFFVNNGMIQYLSDCKHELAGQTIPLPELSETT